MNLLVINKEHLIESKYDDEKGVLIRVDSSESVKEIDVIHFVTLIKSQNMNGKETINFLKSQL